MKKKIDTFIADVFYMLLIAIGILVIMEIGARFFWKEHSGTLADLLLLRKDMEAYSYFDWRDRYFRDAMKPTISGNPFLYEPYSLWKHADKETETINIQGGYRVTWFPEPNPAKEDYIIFFFGGSTAVCLEVPDDLTIPSFIARQLHTKNNHSRSVVRNYSVAGFLNDNEVHLLVNLLKKGERPDAVIFYDGVNETSYKVAQGIPHYHYKLFNSLITRYSIREFLTKLSSKSKLLSLFKEPEREYIEDENVITSNALSMIHDYSDNVDFVHKLATTYGFQAFFFWQPDIFSSEKKLTNEERSVKERYSDLEPGYTISAEAMGKQDFFSRHAQVYNLRDSLDSVKESIFLDYSHITSIGNNAVAKAIVSTISQQPGFNQTE